MRAVPILVLLLAAGCASAGRNPSSLADGDAYCDRLDEYLERGLAAKNTVESRLREDPDFAKASVIFVGESHYDYDLKERTAEILRPFLADAGTCLGLELPPGTQKILSRASPNDDPAALAAKLAERVVQEKLDSTTSWSERREKAKEATAAFVPWMKMALEAIRAGNPVFAFDLDPSSQNPDYGEDALLDQRNRRIADDLERRLGSQCRRIVSVNGLAHVVKTRADGTLASLPERLKKKKIASYLIYNSPDALAANLGKCSLDSFLARIGREEGSYVFSGRYPEVKLFPTILREAPNVPAYRPIFADGTTAILYQSLPGGS